MSERSIAIGVASIGYGEAVNGVVPASYTRLRDIYKGSVAFNFADANQVKIEVEGREDPLAIINRKGDADSIEFSIPSPTTDELVTFVAGQKTVINGRLPTVSRQSIKHSVSPPSLTRGNTWSTPLSTGLFRPRSARHRAANKPICCW